MTFCGSWGSSSFQGLQGGCVLSVRRAEVGGVGFHGKAWGTETWGDSSSPALSPHPLNLTFSLLLSLPLVLFSGIGILTPF